MIASSTFNITARNLFLRIAIIIIIFDEQEVEVLKEMSLEEVKLTWRQGSPAPETMSSYSGSVVTHNNTAYFSMHDKVYSYRTFQNKWNELKQCEYKDFSMAVVNNKLTTIGGSCAGVKATNTLLCLTGSFLSDMKWEELLPPMPTKRERAAAVTTPTHLLVAGGEKTWCGDGLSTVEILTLNTLQWTSASNLPVTMRNPNVTLCREHLYISEHDEIFSCSLEHLLTSTESATTSSIDGSSVWTQLPNIPVPYWASLTTLRGHVLAVGGSDNMLLNIGTPLGTIHLYNRSTDSWIMIGEMPSPRCSILVAVLASNELVVVGGRSGKDRLSCCEIAHL